MSAGKVDVLAVFDKAKETAEAHAHRYMDGKVRVQNIIEARAAVAELIEADKDFDKAEALWREAQTNSTGDEMPGDWRRIAERRWDAFCAASTRRRAALARIGGAP